MIRPALDTILQTTPRNKTLLEETAEIINAQSSVLENMM